MTISSNIAEISRENTAVTYGYCSSPQTVKKDAVSQINKEILSNNYSLPELIQKRQKYELAIFWSPFF